MSSAGTPLVGEVVGGTRACGGGTGAGVGAGVGAGTLGESTLFKTGAGVGVGVE
jgi:hypothetical protein